MLNLFRTIRRRMEAVEAYQRQAANRRSPQVEDLEARVVLNGSTDYVLTGHAWSLPHEISYSFPADGNSWDGGTNNINAALDAEFGSAAAWHRDVAKALQTWALWANIDVFPVADDDAPFNAAGVSENDPRFGDIRFGGYNFNDPTTLAQTYYAPPNGLTAAGDNEVNTGFVWGPKGPYDFFSVELHEMGLALGLGETSGSSPAVMNTVYGGVRTGLTAGDIAGIQAIYGARTADAFQAAGQATTLANAANLTSRFGSIGAGLQQLTVTNASLDAIGDTEYFRVTVPAGSNEILGACATAQNWSGLSPKVTIENASGQPLASIGNAAAWSDGVQTHTNVQSGQTIIIAVTGATNDAFSVGDYVLQLTVKGVGATAPTHAPQVVPNVVAPNLAAQVGSTALTPPAPTKAPELPGRVALGRVAAAAPASRAVEPFGSTTEHRVSVISQAWAATGR